MEGQHFSEVIAPLFWGGEGESGRGWVEGGGGGRLGAVHEKD